MCKNKNWDVGWIVKWVGKTNKIVSEDAKYVFFFSFFASVHASNLKTRVSVTCSKVKSLVDENTQVNSGRWGIYIINDDI